MNRPVNSSVLMLEKYSVCMRIMTGKFLANLKSIFYTLSDKAMKTCFASPERDSPDTLQKKINEASSNPVINGLLLTVSGLLAVLNDNFLTVHEEGIQFIEPVLTVINGRIVYGAAEFSDSSPPIPPASPAAMVAGKSVAPI